MGTTNTSGNWSFVNRLRPLSWKLKHPVHSTGRSAFTCRQKVRQNAGERAGACFLLQADGLRSCRRRTLAASTLGVAVAEDFRHLRGNHHDSQCVQPLPAVHVRADWEFPAARGVDGVLSSALGMAARHDPAEGFR